MCAAFEGAQCDNERTLERQNKEGGEKRGGGRIKWEQAKGRGTESKGECANLQTWW